LHVAWPNHITANTFVQNGYIAVDLFFILSGLVISSNYSERIATPGDARRFVCLRFFRLYPLHIAVLAAFFVLECSKLIAQYGLGMRQGGQAPFTNDTSLGALIANIFLIQGFPILDGPGWNGPSWSISCEFFAYLVFSVTVLTGLVRHNMFFKVGTLLAAVSYAAIALTRDTLNVVDLGVVRCLAGFFCGMLIHQFAGRRSLGRAGLFIPGLDIALVMAVVLIMSLTSGPLIVAVIPLAVLTVARLQSDQGPVARLLNTKPAQFLGRISYSIYMVHEFIVVCTLIILKRAFDVPLEVYSIRKEPIAAINPWLGDLLVGGLLVAVITSAALTYAFVEEPGRLFGRRLVALSRNRLARPVVSL
jgi:peptidoglycan/LPS O-acetylase OafA/YrhL